MQVSIALTPSSVTELREMLTVLSLHSPFVPIVSTSPPACQAQPTARDERHGPSVTDYLKASGQTRFKRTAEEISRFGDDIEAAAKERLAGVTIPVLAGPIPAVADHSTLDEDDL